jgi:hypothetical protein
MVSTDDLDEDRRSATTLEEIVAFTQRTPRGRATSWCSCPASARSATPPTREGPASTPRSCRCTRASRPPSSSGLQLAREPSRVVLATNVAETSLTVPGIRYVVDTGVARISRYSGRAKVQRLPIEPISQASANQRSGRCGRVEPGIAVRLYSRGGLRRSARIHRPGDPAHQPRER